MARRTRGAHTVISNLRRVLREALINTDQQRFKLGREIQFTLPFTATLASSDPTKIQVVNFFFTSWRMRAVGLGTCTLTFSLSTSFSLAIMIAVTP
jgi:hypothetical protein